MVLRKINEQYYENGKRYVVADIVADSKPSQLPTTGENVKGLSADDYLAQGSTILTKNIELAMLGETWGDWQ